MLTPCRGELVCLHFEFRVKAGAALNSGFDAAGERLDEITAGKSEGDHGR